MEALKRPTFFFPFRLWFYPAIFKIQLVSYAPYLGCVSRPRFPPPKISQGRTQGFRTDLSVLRYWGHGSILPGCELAGFLPFLSGGKVPTILGAPSCAPAGLREHRGSSALVGFLSPSLDSKSPTWSLSSTSRLGDPFLRCDSPLPLFLRLIFLLR